MTGLVVEPSQDLREVGPQLAVVASDQRMTAWGGDTLDLLTRVGGMHEEDVLSRDDGHHRAGKRWEGPAQTWKTEAQDHARRLGFHLPLPDALGPHQGSGTVVVQEGSTYLFHRVEHERAQEESPDERDEREAHCVQEDTESNTETLDSREQSDSPEEAGSLFGYAAGDLCSHRVADRIGSVGNLLELGDR